MKTPLDNIPLNTQMAYAMAKIPGGCELYFPVDSQDNEVIKAKKIEMQNYLDHRFYSEPTIA